jgi:hypothetical protein
MEKANENPMRKLCGAKTRKGGSCKGLAMANGRCRMHGGPSTGPRTAEGLARLRAARTTHGAYSASTKQFRKTIQNLLSERIK